MPEDGQYGPQAMSMKNIYKPAIFVDLPGITTTGTRPK